MLSLRLALACVTLVCPALAAAQQPPSRLPDGVPRRVAAIPRAELDAITERGRRLAEYDQAAWHGTDAVMPLGLSRERVRGYLARRRSDGLWEVVFGRQSADSQAFHVAYRAVQREIGGTAYSAAALPVPEVDTGWYARAGRALDLARAAFGPPSRPYNAMVIPADQSGDWFVYLVPAPTRVGVYPLGADVRHRVSGDGRTITERRRLHNTVLEFAIPKDAQRPVSGYHTAVLADRPEDTDVFHVLSRQPKLPELIASDSYHFEIAIDGRIAAFDRDTTVRRP